MVGNSREFDFTIRKGILKADFLKKAKKKWDRIPTFHNFPVDKIRKLLINTKCGGGGGLFPKRRKNMNKVVLMGRLTRDPEVRYTQGEMAVGRYTLAVDRRFKRDGEATADFINCVAFGKQAEFAERYFRQGLKVIISGRIQTGSYTNREGRKVYTTDVVVEEQDFAESKGDSSRASGTAAGEAPRAAGELTEDEDGFMNIPEGIEEEMPFS